MVIKKVKKQSRKPKTKSLYTLNLSEDKNCKVNRFRSKSYLHLFDNVRDKSVTLTKREFLLFLKNIKKIQNAFGKLDKAKKKKEEEEEEEAEEEEIEYEESEREEEEEEEDEDL